MPAISTLIDDFENGVLPQNEASPNFSVQFSGFAMSEAGGELNAPLVGSSSAYAGYQTINTDWAIKNSGVFMVVDGAALGTNWHTSTHFSHEAFVGVYLDNDNGQHRFGFYFNHAGGDTQITFQWRDAGTYKNGTPIAWVPGTHLWFRLRESGGTLFWETSSDGQTWVTQRSEAHTWTDAILNNCRFRYFVGSGNVTLPGTLIYDSLNSELPVLLASVTLATEHLAPIDIGWPVPTEHLAQVGSIAAQLTLPTECLAELVAAVGAPTETLTGVAGVDAVPAEHLDGGGVFMAVGAPTEHLGLVRRSLRAPTEHGDAFGGFLPARAVLEEYQTVPIVGPLSSEVVLWRS